jgi:imidazole glycerol-phosphate synthase subunit HisH
MIVIIDYGVGNIRAISNVYKRLNIQHRIARKPDELAGAAKLILPGVGAFDHAMDLINQSGMRETLDELVLGQHVPVLGICVGMQMFSHASEEGNLPGLGWVDSSVRRIDPAKLFHRTRLPHMGWNDVQPVAKNSLLQGLEEDARFYFLHSYYCHCNTPEDIIAVTDYGDKFSCAINSGNIYGVQFHPEKSHHWGIRLLENFAKL